MIREILGKDINVLIVDDSEFERRLVKEVLLAGQQNIKVIGEAVNGQDAVEKVLKLKPNVVIMNIVMPVYDGLWALQKIMVEEPTPVIFFTSLVEIDSDIAEEAYNLGAVDFIIKPQNMNAILDVKQEFLYKVTSASFISKKQLKEFYFSPKKVSTKVSSLKAAEKVIVIGSSAGGIPSLRMLLMKLPKNESYSVVVAQHITSQLLKSLVNSLSLYSKWNVKIAKKGDIVKSSTVLFSPVGSTPNFYRTTKGYIVGLTDSGSQLQPDIGLMFISAAVNFHKNVIGIVLPGLDVGSPENGVVEIKRHGGKIIVEDYPMGMPKTIKDKGLADYVLKVEEMPNIILELLSK